MNPSPLQLAHFATGFRVRYNTLFCLNTMPQLIFAAMQDGEPAGFNNQWHDYAGSAAEGEEMQSWDALCHPEDHPASLTAWQHARRTERPFEAAFRLRRHDGAYRWMLARALPLRSETGAVERWFGRCTDVGDMKALGQSHDLMERELARG